MIAHSISILSEAQRSKCPPLARTQVQRCALYQLRYQLHSVEGRAECPTVRVLHQLRYQLHSVEGRAKCPTVPQRRKLVTGTCAARQSSRLNK